MNVEPQKGDRMAEKIQDKKGQKPQGKGAGHHETAHKPGDKHHRPEEGHKKPENNKKK